MKRWRRRGGDETPDEQREPRDETPADEPQPDDRAPSEDPASPDTAPGPEAATDEPASDDPPTEAVERPRLDRQAVYESGEFPVSEPPASRDRTRRRRARLRRRRPFRTVTPRRWLPFLALIAIVAVGVVASREELPQQTTQPISLPGERLPVAAPANALSTAFFCPGGSALGEEGDAELAIVMANAGTADASADIALVSADGETDSFRLDVPAYGMARVVAADHVEADWVAATVEIFGGDVAVQQQVTGRGVGSDIAACPTSTSDEWFAPAGSTAIGAAEHLIVYNPFPAPAVVSLAFTSGGTTTEPRPLQGITIAGSSIRVFSEDDLPARRDQVATHLTTRTGRVVLGRVQTFDGDGEGFEAIHDGEPVPAPEGISATPAIPATSTRWVFPTAVNDPGTRNAVVVHNPSSEIAEISLSLTYVNRLSNAEIEPIQVTVRGGEVQTVDLRGRPGLDDAIPYTVFVDSFGAGGGGAVPVVAELQTFGAVPRDPVRPPAMADDDDEPGDDHDHDHDDVDVPEDEPGEAPPDDDEPGESPPDEEDPEADPGETPPDAGEPDGGDTDEEETPERVPGYSVLAGSPVSAGRWIIPEVNLSSTVRTDVAVVNPFTDPVDVTVNVIATGGRERVASFELDPGDRRSLTLDTRDDHVTLLVIAEGGGVVVGQTTVGNSRGVGSMLASPVPGTVRTLPPPFVD